MAIASITNFFQVMGTGARLGPADHWDGYVENLPKSILGGIFQGYSLNWGGFDNQSVNQPLFNQQYAGYNSNWGSYQASAIPSFDNALYAGYSTNWGSSVEPIQKSINDIDINSLIDHPKDQTIFYKLKGFNPSNNTYESWIISENITGRPELFDPNRNPPNVERDVYKTPPSNNSLINIVIVARWIQ